MSSTRFDETRDYGFADKALALRERAGLTQRELAVLLAVSGRAIQAWEAGLSYPGADHLTRLIALYVERGAFAAGREEDEAVALCEAVRAHAPHRALRPRLVRVVAAGGWRVRPAAWVIAPAATAVRLGRGAGHAGGPGARRGVGDADPLGAR